MDLVAFHSSDSEMVEAHRESLVPYDKLEDALSRTVVATGEPLLIPDASAEASRARLPAKAGAHLERVHSLLAVPLRSRGEVIGSITTLRRSAEHPYTPEDQSLLEQLTDRAGLAIHDVRLHQELLAAVQVRDDFLAVAGHELRTPLAALLLQLQGLQRAARRESAPASIERRLEKAELSVLRLERLIAQLLDVSRITAGRLHLEPESVDLSELVKEVTARYSEADAGRAISVEAEDHVMGHWDRLRIEQVVSNLVGNAVKYGLEEPIEVTVQTEPHEAIVRITDHGIGIDKEHQEKIFQKFERAVKTRDFGGFGLGLWIARQIVEASGGKIEVESVPGRGSTFAVHLPSNGASPPH
jgi:signal transduction histidine kinase